MSYPFRGAQLHLEGILFPCLKFVQVTYQVTCGSPTPASYLSLPNIKTFEGIFDFSFFILCLGIETFEEVLLHQPEDNKEIMTDILIKHNIRIP